MNMISAATTMGAVTLDVANMAALSTFYSEGVGLSVLAEASGGVITLGRGSQSLIHLRHKPGLKHAGSTEAGLFHTAVLFTDRGSLAAAVARLSQLFPASFTGSADHLVSEAFYFDDPEGNGVELYWDRPQEQWARVGSQIQMDTLALDPNMFLRTHLDETSVMNHGRAASTIGHVHLSVGNIPQASDFYINQLGFDQTFLWNGQALFVAAGGYHHHMAMNVWRSRGAGIRQPSLGLGIVEIVVDGADESAAIADRLRHHGNAVRASERGFDVDDPWGNTVRILEAV